MTDEQTPGSKIKKIKTELEDKLSKLILQFESDIGLEVGDVNIYVTYKTLREKKISVKLKDI